MNDMTPEPVTGAPAQDRRRSWIGAPEAFALDQVADFVNKAFGEHCYLVGSAVEKRDFRDVDVRMIMSDDKFELLFGNHTGEVVPFWSLICTSISEYMGKRTGLKIDFQIQKRSKVKQSDWDKPRVPLAMFPSNIGPAWKDIGWAD